MRTRGTAKNPPSFFLTGTGTSVGKTTTAAALLLRYPSLVYWKPVQTGKDLDRLQVKKLTQLDNKCFLLESYHFSAPLSPHKAAELEKKTIVPEKILQDLYSYTTQGKTLLVEGAGGLLVPLTRQYTWLDFLIDSKLPVVIVALTSLGTINHSLLTAKALQQQQIPILGFVFCGPKNDDNIRTITEMAKITLLGRFDLQEKKNLSEANITLPTMQKSI